MNKKNFLRTPISYLSLGLLSMTLAFTACDDDTGGDPVMEEPTGSLNVGDQFIAETNNRVVVEQVTLSQDGWVVIHRGNGSNSPVVPDIISEPEFLEAGTHTDVMVEIKEGEEVATDEQLWVMLHTDTGQEEVYEFAGGDTPDQPITDSNGNMVMSPLMNSYTFNENTENKMFPLVEVEGSGINGTATMYRAARGDGAYVVLDVEGTPAGGVHPAHIHDGVAGSGGSVAVPLNNVDGDEGRSVTFVDAQSYDELLTYNGYVNVHLSAEDLTVVSTGNIGANGSALTGETKVYTLEERAVEGVNGTATFWELEDGSALVQLMLEGTPADGMHPAHIHVNSAAEGGGIAISLNPVNGSSGRSATFVDMFDEGSPDRAGEAVTYAELLDYNGYINVHMSAEDLGTIVAQGDIGGNELTGESAAYDLTSTDEATDVNGTVTFNQRKNGNTLVSIDVDNTVAGMMHPAHIHEGKVGDNGAIAFPLNDIDGTTGMSMTSIRANAAGTEVSYDELLNFAGYLNVHMSAADLGTVVATGNTGASVE